MWSTIAGVLLLTGCASTSPVSTTTSSASATTSASSTAQPSPSTSVQVGASADSSKHFAVVPPSGWTTAKPPNASVVFAVAAPATTDSVHTNFNVVAWPAVAGQTTEDLAGAGATQMRQQGATVTPSANRTIGGLPAFGYVIERTVESKKIVQTQFFVQNANTVYVATTTSAVSSRDAADAAMNSILASWAWTP